MAVHKRVQQAGRKLLAHVGGAGRKLQRRRKNRRDAGDPDASGLDERLSALAAHIAAGNYFESPWQLFCYRQLKGLSDEQAVKALAAWCTRQAIEMRFQESKVRGLEVMMLVLRRRTT
jgi:hypothetical protein